MSRPPASRRTALTASKYNGLASSGLVSENLATSSKNFVQCLGPERRALGELRAHLLHVFLPALLDLVPEQQGQAAIPDPLLPLLRMVHHEVGDQRPGEP